MKKSSKKRKKKYLADIFKEKKGCMRAKKCWFYHEENLEATKKSKNFKPNPIKKFKDELNIETKQMHGESLMLVIIDMLKLLL